MKRWFLILSLFCLSCGSDDVSNTRAYAEGKVISDVTALADLDISIVSDDKVVAQTKPTASGNFVLSGPLFSDGFKVKFNKKIKRFSAPSKTLSVSEDSLSILVPEEVTYISFEEVHLK